MSQHAPQEPQSQASGGTAEESARPLLEVTDLVKSFPLQKGLFSRRETLVKAVDGISLYIQPGETLGLVGESGCGKSTAGKSILRLIEPTSGSIRFEGSEITGLSRTEMRRYRQRMQIIFQDPYSSLNPRMTAEAIVGEPFVINGTSRGRERQQRVASLFERVGLRPDTMGKYPHEFSGGQRQRIGIARALASMPGLIICDEPVSALDVSIQAQVINLLMDLQAEYRMSYLFIAHDLAVVEHISDRIAVMYLGRIVELTDKRTLFTNPLHPYTEALLSAVPIPDPAAGRERRIILRGDVPSPIDPPPGCHFSTRCPEATGVCRVETPVLTERFGGHQVACHLR
ncbi:MAG: dipeptide ABC transporter ATP-binding protein [Deltaproteobacteria bacterium]|nr:dipeptide ABC transporter ATP-binding protein [Deltaproteobacteria bacterium]